MNILKWHYPIPINYIHLTKEYSSSSTQVWLIYEPKTGLMDIFLYICMRLHRLVRFFLALFHSEHYKTLDAMEWYVSARIWACLEHDRCMLSITCWERDLDTSMTRLSVVVWTGRARNYREDVYEGSYQPQMKRNTTTVDKSDYSVDVTLRRKFISMNLKS